MRIGIISDIHGNLEALEAVLRELELHQLDEIVCLGDVVGYGASPNECCQLVREHCSFTLLGNHDAAACGRMDFGAYYDQARNALQWTRDTLTASHLDWLTGLPYEVWRGEQHYCHGSPVDPAAFEYIFSPQQARALHAHKEALGHITFIGHSHLCKVFALHGDHEVSEVLSAQFRLRRHERYILSVGSIGQPRDYDPRASFVIWEDDTEQLSFYRLGYDIERAASKILLANLAPQFARRLYLGI
jgi:diadenosine tetraphosphatase ApaH/serine/threonine PP2A family protein phosphatase